MGSHEILLVPTHRTLSLINIFWVTRHMISLYWFRVTDFHTSRIGSSQEKTLEENEKNVSTKIRMCWGLSLLVKLADYNMKSYCFLR